MVPVLAMLLQFSPKELSAVQRAAMLEPAGSGASGSSSSFWASMMGSGGGGSGGGAMAFSSSRPAKEVKRYTPGSTSAKAVSATPSASSSSAGQKHMSSGALTTAALAASPHTAAGGVNHNNAKASTPTSTSASGGASLYIDAPLSPTTSNSDIDAGTYSPPALPTSQPSSGAKAESSQSSAPQPSTPLKNNNNIKCNNDIISSAGSALMVEMHTDNGHSTNPDFGTPVSIAKVAGGGGGGSAVIGVGSRRQLLGSGSKSGSGYRMRRGDASPANSFIGTPNTNANSSSVNNSNSNGGRRPSSGRMMAPRSSSMNNSEYEFQLKLKRIGSDVLSLEDNSVSYDDDDINAQFVEVEDGIDEEEEYNEEGDEREQVSGTLNATAGTSVVGKGNATVDDGIEGTSI